MMSSPTTEWSLHSNSCLLFVFFFFIFSSTSLLLPTHLPPPSCTHAQSCNPMDFSLPDSSVHGFFQARILEWVAISFSTTPVFLSATHIPMYWISREVSLKMQLSYALPKTNAPFHKEKYIELILTLHPDHWHGAEVYFLRSWIILLLVLEFLIAILQLTNTTLNI